MTNPVFGVDAEFLGLTERGKCPLRVVATYPAALE